MYAYIVFIRDGDINKQNLIYITNYTYQFEFIFLFLVSKFLYNTKYYKHQNISMIILVLIALIKFIFNFYETEIEKVVPKRGCANAGYRARRAGDSAQYRGDRPHLRLHGRKAASHQAPGL